MESETPGQTGGVSPSQSPTCPHIRGRTTQWCALGQATGEAERALMRLGAAWLLGTSPWESSWAALDEYRRLWPTGTSCPDGVKARARALLAETHTEDGC